MIVNTDQEFQASVCERDRRCCRAGCLTPYHPLTAHHVLHRRYLAGRYDTRNGIALCHECHTAWAHGKGAGVVEEYAVSRLIRIGMVKCYDEWCQLKRQWRGVIENETSV